MPIRKPSGSGFGSPATTQQQQQQSQQPLSPDTQALQQQYQQQYQQHQQQQQQQLSARGGAGAAAAAAAAAKGSQSDEYYADGGAAGGANLNGSGEFASPRQPQQQAGQYGSPQAAQQAQYQPQPHQWPSQSVQSNKAGWDPLERERKEIERRRARFDDRKQRILQAKTRIIGIDKSALDAQVKEHEDRKKREAEEKLYFDQMTASHAKLLSEVERERQRARAAKDEEVSFYRKQQELAMKKKKVEERQMQLAKVPLHHPLDATTAAGKGATVFLDFKGEDLGKAAREAEQKKQQQAWLEQQLTLANTKEAAQRAEEADYAAQVARITEMKKQMEAEAQAARKSLHKQTQSYNSLQHNERRRALQAQAEAEAAQKNAEIEAQLNSELLNEKQSADALRANFKGFTTEQRLAIINQQNQQIAALQAKRAAEVQSEADWAKMQADMQREMVRADQAKAAREREARQQLQATHLHQQKQHQSEMRRLNKEVYTNPVAPAFFDQFGTSHR